LIFIHIIRNPPFSIPPKSYSFKLLFLAFSYLQAFLTVSSTPFSSQLILFRHACLSMAGLVSAMTYRINSCAERDKKVGRLSNAGLQQKVESLPVAGSPVPDSFFRNLCRKLRHLHRRCGGEQSPGTLQVTAKDKSDEAPAGQVAPHNCVEPFPSLLPGMSGVITFLEGWETAAAVKVGTRGRHRRWRRNSQRTHSIQCSKVANICSASQLVAICFPYCFVLVCK
jgi:hypothetical protein